MLQWVATVALDGATAIVAPMLPLYPDISPEIIAIAIGSGAIGCTIVTDSLFWLVKQCCGATLNETFKYYTTATFIASSHRSGGHIPAVIYHLAQRDVLWKR
ncbi:MAG: hypothetical protein ACLRP3_11025 [Escherichia sp.]